MTNTQDETEINHKQLSVSNACYTVSFHSLMNMTLIRFSWRVTPSRRVCVAVRFRMFLTFFKMFFFLMPFWSEVIQVVKSCCVHTVSLESDPESAEAGRHVGAGYRIQAETQLLPQRELLPGYSN